MEEFFRANGQKPFRARQLMGRVYKQKVTDFFSMTEFAKPLREELDRTFEFRLPELVEKQKSEDGTEKLLLRMDDGELVETVLIPDGDRLTQCISSQAGCAMGCEFCRTATSGLTRNLTTCEIVGQVAASASYGSFDMEVTNVVFMGMGEPLANFDHVMRAYRILTGDWGFDLSWRKVTISTCGLVEKIKMLPPELLPGLAISLNATTDEVRSRIMPVNRAHPITELIGTLESLKLPTRARYTIEYVLLGGLNDSLDDAKRLVRLLSNISCKVNLIPYNPHGESEFKAPDPEAVKRFQSYLLGKNMNATMRKSRGQDILAACGQLKAKELEAGEPDT